MDVYDARQPDYLPERLLRRRNVEMFNTTDIPKSARITRLVDRCMRKCR